MMRLIVFVFFTFSIALKCAGQEYHYYHYDVKDGLSGNTIYSIAQDNDGFLWFGTETGLTRFDGSNFKNYSNNDGLYDNEIISLFVDSKNRIWIFPFKNAVYYYYQGKIHNNSNDTLLKQLHLKNEIFKACEDKKGNIFFIEHKRLHIIAADNKVTEIDQLQTKNFNNNTCGVVANGNCNIYLSFEKGSDHRVSVFEYKDSHFELKADFQDSNFSRNSLEINSSYTVIRNGLFFKITNLKTNAYYKTKVPNDFHTLSYINDSCFIISTLNKTLLFNINQKKVIDSFLTNKVTNRCLRDKENNLWFATMAQGVYRLSSTKFKVYRIGNNISPMPVYALNSTTRDLYIGSDKNLLWKLNLKANNLEATRLQINYTINNISNIAISEDNDLFLGSNIGLLKHNKNKNFICLPETSIKSSFIYQTSILVATDRAVFELPLPTCSKLDTIWSSRAICAVKTDNRYYVGTLNGLYAVKNNPERSIIDIGKELPILKDKITAVSPGADKTIWVATESNGIACIKNDKLTYHLTVKKGLTSNACRCIYIDSNNVWVGTNKGISKIDISHTPFTVTNFTLADGLDCEIINCLYTKGDSVFAGTPFGLSFFRDTKIDTKSIANLKLLDIQSKKSNWYYKQDSIQLSSNDNFLHFEYAGISFMSAGDITYYYQLKGLSDDWQSTKQNIVEFQSLRSGDYQFNIYAVNKYGNKSNIVSVPFSKAKTFWELPWVWLLLAISIALLSWLIIKWRIKIIKNHAEEELLREKQLSELEQMALRSQMNPHFIFNSLNSIKQYVFAGNVLEANHFITEFSSLVRQTLYISAKKFISLEEEIKYLDAYLGLEQIKYENTFTFKIHVDENMPEDIPVPPLLVQPFIENSIRHGVLNLKNEDGEILVHFFKKKDHLLCIVKDNGVGRESAMKLKAQTQFTHQSKGMELVQKRIESLNSLYKIAITINIDDIIDANKTGTQVTIKLPLNYDDK